MSTSTAVENEEFELRARDDFARLIREPENDVIAALQRNVGTGYGYDDRTNRGTGVLGDAEAANQKKKR